MAPKNRFPLSKLSPTTNDFQGSDIESLMLSFVNHLEYSFAKDENSATMLDFYKSLALTTRDRLIERWVETQHTYYKKDVKRVYYLSMEYLTGRLMHNALINLGLEENMREALAELGLELDELEAIEPDAGLGNGGLGRLAACFLDSMATLKLPCYGYGIRYEYGIFAQKIINGEQVEFPDGWLHFGNPWEIEHPDYYFQIQFYGHVNQYTDESGKLISEWLETDDVRAIAYDTPVPGHRNNTVNHLRLWAAKSSKAFDLTYFNHGDYQKAVEHKVESETISRVLYPNDEKMRGRELRLKQEYFFVSATLQDIVRRHKLRHNDFDNFPDKVAIQLNDTHPAVAIAELMRLFLDIENLDWDKAWSICTCVFAYTNHTILPEALEKWRVTLFGQLLPRHLQIVYEINRRFIEQIRQRFPGDEDRVRRMSIIEEGPEKRIRMAYLAIVGSHKVNGVAALHSQIIRETLFKDFAELWPEKFTNKTNGISQRRWLQACNPRLAELITSTIGDDGWLLDLYKLKSLASLADDSRFQKKWQKVKRANKQALADFIFEKYSVRVNVDSIFDCQIKRIHEYKRQLLNILHAITLYNRIKAQPEKKFTPRTILFAGKAAPGYKMAKLIIKLINDVAEVINGDPDVGDRLKVLFLEDYSVSLAEKMIPAADLSEQISTAGMEASGTGNMKFALNGAITIGTLDGANIEILQEVGEENIFIFGLKADEIMTMRAEGYNPWDYYNSNPELKKALDMISNGHFSSEEPERFRAIIDSLLHQGDYYMLLAGYENYIACQEKVNEAFDDQRRWAKMSILNVANMGVFSSDRTIQEYAEDIWDVSPTEIQIPAGSAPKSWKSTLHHLFKAKE